MSSAWVSVAPLCVSTMLAHLLMLILLWYPLPGIKNILVGAMDAEIGKALIDAGINSFAM